MKPGGCVSGANGDDMRGMRRGGRVVVKVPLLAAHRVAAGGKKGTFGTRLVVPRLGETGVLRMRYLRREMRQRMHERLVLQHEQQQREDGN